MRGSSGQPRARAPFWRELPIAMSRLAGDPELRAVVLAARGRDFSVGLDLAEEATIL